MVRFVKGNLSAIEDFAGGVMKKERPSLRCGLRAKEGGIP